MQGIDEVDAFVVSDPSIVERGTDLSFPLVAGRLLGRRRVVRRIVVAALHSVGAMENCEFGLGPHARARENFRERRAGPFADATPALHAIMSGDLRAWGKARRSEMARALVLSTSPPTRRRQSAKFPPARS